MGKWEYRVEGINLSERWSPKRQKQELQAFQEQLTAMGAENWELISYQAVPLFGTISNTPKAHTYLAIFKRPMA